MDIRRSLVIAIMLVACGSGPASSQVQLYDPAQFEVAMGERPDQLIDVRTPGEWAEGVIAGARTIDFLAPEFRERIAELDRAVPVFVYCASGGRSQKATAIMEELGFARIHELDGGIQAWQASGRPVVGKDEKR